MRSAYNEIVGDKSDLAPEWPITVKGIHSLEVLSPNAPREYEGKPYSNQNNPYRKSRSILGENIRAEHCLPFNQVTFEKMINLFQSYIDEEASAETQVKLLSYKNLDWGPHYRARVETKQMFELFKFDIENRLAIHGFSRALVLDFIDGLSGIDTTKWWPKHMENVHATLAQDSKPSRAYLKFLEVYLRIAYTQDNTSIPGAYLEPWETYWGYIVEVEFGKIGGTIGEYYQVSQSYVRLLELPCSLLMGWHFGDASTFSFFISPSELEAGNWDAAFGDISN